MAKLSAGACDLHQGCIFGAMPKSVFDSALYFSLSMKALFALPHKARGNHHLAGHKPREDRE